MGAHLGSGSGKNVAQGVQRRGPAAEGNRARVRGRGRGAPGSWTPQVDAGCSCGGSGGVSVARDAAAAGNFPEFNSPAMAGYGRNSGAAELDSGSTLSVRLRVPKRSRCGGLRGTGLHGAVWPHRRSELCGGAEAWRG